MRQQRTYLEAQHPVRRTPFTHTTKTPHPKTAAGVEGAGWASAQRDPTAARTCRSWGG
jgi:hypothetical protein